MSNVGVQGHVPLGNFEIPDALKCHFPRFERRFSIFPPFILTETDEKFSKKKGTLARFIKRAGVWTPRTPSVVACLVSYH